MKELLGDRLQSFDFGTIPDFPPDYPTPPILPTVGNLDDSFLNVMYVTDADGDCKYIPSHLITFTAFCGEIEIVPV